MTLVSGRGTLHSSLSCCLVIVGQALPLGFFSFGPSLLMVWQGRGGGGGVSLEMEAGGKKAKGKVKVNGAHLLRLP